MKQRGHQHGGGKGGDGQQAVAHAVPFASKNGEDEHVSTGDIAGAHINRGDGGLNVPGKILLGVLRIEV